MQTATDLVLAARNASTPKARFKVADALRRKGVQIRQITGNGYDFVRALEDAFLASRRCDRAANDFLVVSTIEQRRELSTGLGWRIEPFARYGKLPSVGGW